MRQTLKLKELSFLVYGLGSTGISVINFFKKNKVKNFKVWDDDKKNLFKIYRSHNLSKTLKEVNYIVLSPGISLARNKRLKKFEKKIITDIDLFYLTNQDLKSVVVTGTNGKSTTCKLLAHLLKKNKFRFSLGGNIGTPILDTKNSKNSYAIIEASSFQLSHSKFVCPDFAFFLNLTNDHLDWHGSMHNYLNAKLKIFRHQTTKHFAIINKNFKNIFKKKKFSSKIIFPEDTNYQKIKEKIKNDYLISNINNENMKFVYIFSKLLKISEKSFIKSMNTFKGLPHRFEIFLKKNNVTFINDSKATSFKATQSALSSLKNIYWILGGLPKKNDRILLSGLKNNIIKCYLVGRHTDFFKKQINGKIDFSITKNLNNSLLEIIKDSKINKGKKLSIILSPAAASFDQFSNFEKRGEEFKKLSKVYVRKFI